MQVTSISSIYLPIINAKTGNYYLAYVYVKSENRYNIHNKFLPLLQLKLKEMRLVKGNKKYQRNLDPH